MSWICVASSLFACGGGGGSNRSGVVPTVTNQAPTASFTVDISSGVAPLTVVVDAAASNDPDGQIVSYSWDFTGETSIGQTAVHTYTDAGSFVVTLSVVDNDGATTASSRTITATTSPTNNVSISGVIRVLSSTAVDSDVNDRLTIPQPNNNFDQAQAIPSPVTLGGFANRAGTGQPTGNFFAQGDPRDFYQVSLTGEEVISLNIAETSADLDLRLWDANRNIVDSSSGVTQTETIQVNQAGTYFIEIFPFSGASNYVLYIGQDLTSNSTQRPAQRLSDPFIAGELIVKTIPSAASKSQSTFRIPGIRNSDNAAESVLFRYQALVALYRLMADPSALRLPVGGYVTTEQRERLQTLVALKSLLNNPHIEFAEPNVLLQRHRVPNDTFYSAQWHYQAINLPLAWDTTTGDQNVIVAVIDTGVLLNHPDLSSQLVDGYDFIADANRALDSDGIDANPNDPGDLAFGGSSSFHGTHVAGTVGATSDNSQGVAGVSWNTRIMPLRVLGRDGGTAYDMIQAVRFAAGLSNDSNTLPLQKADIINLSLGTTLASQSAQQTFDEVRQAGVIVVASAGNSANSLPNYPAAYDGVIGVSATTISNDRANYSNFGTYVDIAAPGGSNTSDLNGDGIADSVISTVGDDGAGNITFTYAAQSGTSMAAPHVSGVIALMKAVHPTMTPIEFEIALMAGDLTDDLGTAGRDDQFGYGLVNAHKAVLKAQQLANGQGSDPGPVLSIAPRTLNFGAFVNDQSFSLRNVGTGNIAIGAITSSDAWITVTSPSSADGLGEYQISVSRNNLSDGAYQGNIHIASDTNSVNVTVIMQVSNLNLTANAGLMYVIVVDEDNVATLPPTLVLAIDGEYPYSIPNIPVGQYRIFAGTDADDDSVLCDSGESCGAYPTLNGQTILPINGDLDNIDFESVHRVTLTGTSVLGNLRSNSALDGGIVMQKPQPLPSPAPRPGP